MTDKNKTDDKTKFIKEREQFNKQNPQKPKPEDSTKVMQTEVLDLNF